MEVSKVIKSFKQNKTKYEVFSIMEYSSKERKKKPQDGRLRKFPSFHEKSLDLKLMRRKKSGKECFFFFFCLCLKQERLELRGKRVWTEVNHFAN